MKQVLNWMLVAGVSMAAPLHLAQAADTAEMSQPLPVAADAGLAKPEFGVQPTPNVLNLLREIEALKAEVAKLRGLTEVQAHQLDTLDKRQTDLYADLDQRLTELAKEAKAAAPMAADTATVAPPDAQVESAAYEAALKLFREENYTAAIAAFKTFFKT